MNLHDATKDEVWGWVLIGVGIASLVFKPFNLLDEKLQGTPEKYLTIALISVILFYGLIAWKGDAAMKALALFWMVSP